jgi:tripartite-type tricarboxylate transporter receptor subunit TctC
METPMPRRHALVRAAALALLGSVNALLPAAAQTSAAAWPDHPIRVVLPFPPGGPSDIVMRLSAEKMQAVLKQPIVIDNKPGAGGNLGSAEVARAPADGYTWLFGPDSLVTVNPHVYKQMPFKVEQLLPVTIATQFNQTLVCNPALGVKTVAELIAKAKSESLSYASGGLGVPGALVDGIAAVDGGLPDAPHPVQGPGARDPGRARQPGAVRALAGPTVLPHVRAGKLVALAVSGSRRSPTLPDVPTLAEAGVAGYEADFTLVVFAPRGVPDAIVGPVPQAFVDAINRPDIVEKLRAGDQTVVGSTPATPRPCSPPIPGSGAPVARRIQLGLD